MEINKKALEKALKNLANSVAPSTNNSILTCIKIEDYDLESIKISSTNNEIYTTISLFKHEYDSDFIPADICIDYKIFLNTIKNIKDSYIFLAIDKINYTLKVGKKYNLCGVSSRGGVSSKEFPIVNTFSDNLLILDQKIFKECLQKIEHAIYKGNIKPVFNAVFLKYEEKINELNFVATDSKRLGLSKYNNTINTYEMQECYKEGIIIPYITIKQLLNLLSEGQCLIYVKNNKINFYINNILIQSRLIDGTFPNYKQIIPNDFENIYTIKTSDFYNEISEVYNFSAIKCKLEFYDNNCNIISEVSEKGIFKSIVSVKSEKIDFNINFGLNSSFILDALKVLKNSEFIEFKCTGQMLPVIIKDKDDNSFISVIMPIQLNK